MDGVVLKGVSPKIDRDMYIPKDFLQTDENEIRSYLNKYSFGILISNIDNVPYATHLPFTWENTRNGLVINSHLAKANPHADHLNSADALFIIQGPHTYISVRNYSSSRNVPTWNYIAMHLYGKVELIRNAEMLNKHLDDLLQKHEPHAALQWDHTDENYKREMLKRIVSFQLKVERVECKAKLSQNRNEAEQKSIIADLLNTSDTAKKEIANYMIMNLRRDQKDG